MDAAQRPNWKFWTAIVTAIIGPVVSFYFATKKGDTNHAESSAGYSLLANMVNQHEGRLDIMEKTLQRIELQTRATAASTQPSVSLTGPIIVPGGRVDPWPHVATKAPLLSKAPAKAVVVVNPKYAPAPASAPVVKLPKRAPQRAPLRLEDVR
jgi:hypothetical protein